MGGGMPPNSQPPEGLGGMGPRPPMGVGGQGFPPGMGDRPPVPTGPQGPKQPEMMWPPDSNEMDEDIDDDEEMGMQGPPPPNAGPMNMGPRSFGRGEMIRPPMGGPDSGGPRGQMMQRPPGGFPPGGMPGPIGNQPWGPNRMGGPGHGLGPMGMGPRGRGGPNRFGGPQNMGGMGGPPRGPQFMPGGRGGGFQQRFNQPNTPNKGPVSLFDLPDVKPTFDRHRQARNFEEEEKFYDESDNYNDGDNYNERNNDEFRGGYNDEQDNYYGEGQDGEENMQEAEEDMGNSEKKDVYPFNTWTSVKSGQRNGNRDKSRDTQDKDNTADNAPESQASRSQDSKPGSESQTGAGRDRDRSRKSRWGTWDNEKQAAETLEEEMRNAGKDVQTQELATDGGNVESLPSEEPVVAGDGNVTESVSAGVENQNAETSAADVSVVANIQEPAPPQPIEDIVDSTNAVSTLEADSVPASQPCDAASDNYSENQPVVQDIQEPKCESAPENDDANSVQQLAQSNGPSDNHVESSEPAISENEPAVSKLENVDLEEGECSS